MDREELYSILKNVLKTAVPVAMLGASPLFLDGCACPREERSTIVPVTALPHDYEECVSLCRQALDAHYRQQISRDGAGWSLGQIRQCEPTTVLDQGKSGSVIQPAVRCDHVVVIPCVGGRLPAGLQPREAIQAIDQLGQYFAQLCFLEKAAVVAFEVLARELQVHGAPDAFVDRALQAVQEEREHAEMTALLAELYGAKEPQVQVEAMEPRGLEPFAYENALEGCIRETYAPLVAQWQTLHSSSPEVRAVMARIASEESGHAGLSWEIDRWVTPKLSPEQRQHKRRLQRQAVQELGQEVQREPTRAMVEIAGLPSASDAQVLYDGLRRELWQV